MLALTFFASAGGSVGGSAIEALLYSRQGTAALPALYMGLGVTTFAVTVAITAVLGRIPRTRLYLVLPLVLAAGLVIQRAILVLDISWTYALFWLLMNVEGSLQGLLGWGVAAIACDTRQAKRLFPLFAAGGIFGGVLGGFATRPLAGLLGAENLILVWAAALVAVFAATRALLAGRAGPRASARTGVIEDMQAGLRYVRSSPLWGAVSAATVLFAVLYFSIAFPFSRAATATYPNATDLAGFFGLFGGATTGAAFLASLFVANRLYARIGLMAAIFIFPLVYAGGFASLLVTQTAFAAVAGFRFAQLTYLQGVAGPAYESLFNVIPTERRDQVRAFVSGVPDQTGIVIAGAVLLVGDRVLDASQFALIGLIAAVACAALWRRASAEYANELVRTLRAGQPPVFWSEDEPFGGFLKDALALMTLRAAATDPDARTRRIAIEMLGHLGSSPDAMAFALADAEPDVRLAAARALSGSDPLVLASVLGDADPAVRATAAAGLLDADVTHASSVLDPFTRSGDPAERLIAVQGLAHAVGPRATTALLRFVADEDARVRAAAVRGVRASDASALAILASAIRDPIRSVRAAAAHSLARIGAPALETAVAALEDPASEHDALEALHRMPASAVAAGLERYARRRASDAQRYYALARGVSPTDAQHALARDALLRSARRHARSALVALASIAAGEAFDAALNGLESREATQRANALETLETVGNGDLVRPLLAVFEDVTTTVPATDLASLRDDPDPWIREVSAITNPDGGAQMETLAILSTMERVLFLRQVPLFAELPPADLKQVATIAGEHLYADGVLIAHEGDAGDELLVIVEGQIRVVTGGKTIALRTRGDYVGEMAVLDGERRSASLVAAGQVRALRVGRRELETIMRERPETSFAMLVVLTRRLREMMRAEGAQAR